MVFQIHNKTKNFKYFFVKVFVFLIRLKSIWLVSRDLNQQIKVPLPPPHLYLLPTSDKEKLYRGRNEGMI